MKNTTFDTNYWCASDCKRSEDHKLKNFPVNSNEGFPDDTKRAFLWHPYAVHLQWYTCYSLLKEVT